MAQSDNQSLLVPGWPISCVSPYNLRSFVEHDVCVEDEIHYKLLKVLEENPDVTQRELAARLGVSLGKANYCLRALMKRGWVKMDNFRRNPNKMGYVYLLTPSGIEEKARIAVRFLRQKLNEFDALKAEIEHLKVEVADSATNESVSSFTARPIKDNASEPFSVFPAKCFELNEIRS